MNYGNYFQYIVRGLVLLTCIPAHEAAHAYVSYRLGDPTARNLGRMTLNPIVHLDLVGSLMMIVFGFGWAKPVPILTRNFKDVKKGMAISALAGPAANVLMALALMIVYKLLLLLLPLTNTTYAVIYIIWIMVSLNCGLAVFNLIPIPPLDGSRLLTALLPAQLYFKIMAYERYIMIGLMALIWLGVLDGPLYFLQNGLLSALDFVTGFLG